MKIKHFVMSALLSFSLALPSQAQQKPVKIVYSNKIPAVVRQRVPKGGKTKFFGSAALRTGEPKVFCHLYMTPAPEPLEENARLKTYVVDIFQQNRNKKMQRLNSVRFQSDANYRRVSAQALWVVPKHQHIPIFLFDLYEPDMSFGSYGTYFLVNFPQGLKAKANVQEFAHESNNSGGYGLNFYDVDERGYMMISTSKQEVDKSTSGQIRWSGDRFGPSTEKTIEIR